MKHRMVRLYTVVALLAALAVLVTACARPPAPTAETPTPESPRAGGILVIGRTEDTESLDPHRTTTISSAEVLFLTNDTLVTLDYDMSIKPGLAERWDISPDGTVYTFHLRRDVRFHSGKPLVASDVKFTFEKWLATEGSPTAYLIRPIERIETPDDHTVVFHLKEPYAIFLDNLASSWASILNEEAVRQAGDDYGVTTVDGTGPFRFKEWIKGERLVVERNPDFRWGPPIVENAGPAHLDAIEFRVIPEAATRLAELEAGSIHFTGDIPPVEVQRLEKVPGVQIVRFGQLNTTFIGFKLGKAPLDDIRVRRAINHAINKKEIVEGAYYGMAEEAWGPIAPATWGYNPAVRQIGYGYDPDAARRLLEEAGWMPGPGGIRQKDGRPLKILLMYSTGPQSDVIIPMVQAQLRQVGIDTELRLLEWTAYLAALRAGEHEMMWMWVRYTTADILYFYFHSSQRPAPNRFDWADERTDELLRVSRTAVDPEERLRAYHELQEIVVREAIWAPLLHAQGLVGATRSVQGLRVHPANILYKGLDLWLEH